MRLIIHQIFNLGFARIVATVANILVFMLAARYLSQADYGRLRQFFVPYDLLSPIITMGIPAGILYVIRKIGNIGAALRGSVLIISITCAIYTLIFLFISPIYTSPYFISGSLGYSIALLGLYAFAQSLQQIVQPFAIQTNRSYLLAVNTLLFSFALSATTWLILHVGADAEDLVLVRSVILLLAGLQLWAVIAVIPMRDASGVGERSNGTPQDLETIVRYCFPLAMASGINAISLGIDKLIVSLGTDEGTYAIYANGAMELPLVGVLVGAVSTVILSEMVRAIDSDDKQAALSLFRASGSYAALFVFPLFVASFYFAESLMTILFSSKYAESADIFRIYLLVLPVRIVVFGAAIIALGQGSKILVRGCIELALNALLAVGLFYMWGPSAVPFSFVISTYLWSVPYNMHLIARGFQVGLYSILDFRFLTRIALLCGVFSPVLMITTAIVGESIAADAFSIFLYFSCIIVCYWRMGLFQKLMINQKKIDL